MKKKYLIPTLLLNLSIVGVFITFWIFQSDESGITFFFFGLPIIVICAGIALTSLLALATLPFTNQKSELGTDESAAVTNMLEQKKRNTVRLVLVLATIGLLASIAFGGIILPLLLIGVAILFMRNKKAAWLRWPTGALMLVLGGGAAAMSVLYLSQAGSPDFLWEMGGRFCVTVWIGLLGIFAIACVYCAIRLFVIKTQPR